MRKKIGALAGAVLLCIPNMILPASAQPLCETNVIAASGLEVINTQVEYTQDKNLSVEFEVENIASEEKEVNIIIDVSGVDGETDANALIARKIKPGNVVPVKFTSSHILEEDSLNVFINVSLKDALTDIYVSEKGNDANEGTYQKPLKTLEAALDKAEEFNSDSKFYGKDVSIIFRKGRYELQSPVTITGFENLSSLTLKSDGNEVIFSGGITVNGSDFTRVTNTSDLSMFDQSVHGKIYSIDLNNYGISKISDDPIYTTLYYNGKTEQIAKYPNDGYSNTANTVWNGKNFSFNSEDVKQWTNYDEAWVRGFFIYEWDLAKGIVSDISNGTVSVKEFLCGSMPSEPAPAEDKPWYIYNLPAELDKEGEYVIKNNVLYYYPPQQDVLNGDFKQAQIQLNTNTKDMLIVENIENLTVEDIIFENSQGYFINAKENAGVNNFSVLGCEFRNNSQSAVYIFGDNNLVSSCDFHDIGGRGIIFGGGDRDTLTPSGSVLQNCYFYGTGIINRTNQPAIHLAGCGVTAKNNTVTKTPHTAVSYTGNNHVLEYNDIYDCLLDSTGDAGLIYVGNDLSNIGTQIRYNYLHDSKSGMGAIYWDDRLSGQTAHHNVFENLKTILFIHGGVCDTFNDNYVKNADYGVQVRGKEIYQTINGVKYNMWDEINGRYNAYANVFLGNLVGIPESGGAYPGLPWKGDIWQNAYGNVLKYVNNKKMVTAEETTVQNNYFIDVEMEINPFAGTSISDVAYSGNSEEITQEKQAEYDNIKTKCGIYSDLYRVLN